MAQRQLHRLSLCFTLVSAGACSSATPPLKLTDYDKRISALAKRDEKQDSYCHLALNGDGSVTRKWCFKAPNEIEVVDLPEEEHKPAPSSDFSILTWSCVEPFSYVDGAELPTVRARRSLALHTLALRAAGKVRIADFPEYPSLGLALGDQVYVDPEPDHPGKDHATLAAFGGPLSAHWSAELPGIDAFFNAAYRAYLLNEPIHETLKELPTVMVWDDHEIRDGWGSHGDEARGPWPEWFDSAGRHFVDWQLKRGPLGEGIAWTSRKTEAGGCRGFPQKFEAGPMRAFVFDTRTCRSTPPSGEATVLGPLQLAEFKRWIDPKECAAGKIWTIGSSTPLFVTDSSRLRLNVSRTLGNWKQGGELTDDLLDSWGHERHAAEQNAIIRAIADRLSTCPEERLLVLSGDIHQSGLIGISMNGVNVGYEVISSGVAADVGGSHRYTWYGLDPYTDHRTPMAGDWLGITGTSPSFAEVRLRREPEKELELDLAWFVSAAYGQNALANVEAFVEQRCPGRTAPTLLEPVPARCARRCRKPGTHSVLVDRLRFGETRATVKGRFVNEVRKGSIVTDLHSSAEFSVHPTPGDAPLEDLSAKSLCDALGVTAGKTTSRPATCPACQ